MGEKWGKVGPRSLVMSVMLGGPTPKAKGHQVVHGPGEVVATVVLGGDVNVKDHEAPSCEAVAPQQDGVHCRPESHAEQLPARQVLGDQAEGLVVLVVDGVEGAVKPGNPVVQEVPQVVLEIKDDHAAQDAEKEAPERGGLRRQRGRRPPQPLRNRRGEDEEQVVVDGDTQGGPDVRPGDGFVRMQPVAVDGGPGGSQQVQRGVNTNQDKVGGDGEDHWEERAPEQVVVVLVEVVPERLQDQGVGLAPGQVSYSRQPRQSLSSQQPARAHH